MHTTPATNAYGPGYYQALLAQSEDEVVKPKRTSATQVNIEQMRRRWTK